MDRYIGLNKAVSLLFLLLCLEQNKQAIIIQHKTHTHTPNTHTHTHNTQHLDKTVPPRNCDYRARNGAGFMSQRRAAVPGLT